MMKHRFDELARFLLTPLFPPIKKPPVGWLFYWRRWRDSNSRTACNGYTISNRARSTSYATSPYRLRRSLVYLGTLNYYNELSVKNQVFFSRFQKKSPTFRKSRAFVILFKKVSGLYRPVFRRAGTSCDCRVPTIYWKNHSELSY